MPNAPNIPYLTDAEIRRQAEMFLETYHPSRSLPIPVEEIIDRRLKVHITSIPGLEAVFDIVSFTGSDCRVITVDEFVYFNRPARFCFSLAHERGHILLHRRIYGQARFRTIDEWKGFVEWFPPAEYTLFEQQAYQFAGYLLVPRTELERETDAALRLASGYGMVVRLANSDLWEYVATYIAEQFAVSTDVIVRRWRKERIRTAIWLRAHGFIRA